MTDESRLQPVGLHFSDTTIGTATAIPAPSDATHVLIQALKQNVRYTLDGTTPTATIGFRLTADSDPALLGVGSFVSIRVIEETAGGEVQAQPVRMVR